jgi:hypothetical protein
LRDRGCAFPGCTHNRFLHGHHIQHWLHGGETSLDNLSLLCSHHHHLVHEGGWSVERTADGDLCINQPEQPEIHLCECGPFEEIASISHCQDHWTYV